IEFPSVYDSGFCGADSVAVHNKQGQVGWDFEQPATIYWKKSLPVVGGLELDDHQGLFKPKLFCGSVMIL
ncbi:hypothetical protein HGM15179_010767, partial [Zosterops borbonicus]